MTHRGQGNDQATPADGQPWGQPWGARDEGGAGYQAYGGQDAYGDQGHGGHAAGGHGGYGYPQQADPSAYAADGYGGPYEAAYGDGAYGGGTAHDDGTAHGGGAYGGAQPLPAEVMPAGSADATRFLPPMPGGAAPGAADPTQFIPPYPQAAGPGADQQATQYIPPVGQQGPGYGQQEEAPRQPPAEFDNLFRSTAARRRQVGQVGLAAEAGRPESTQQLPQFPGPETAVSGSFPPAPAAPGGFDDAGRRRGGRPGRRKSPLLIVAAVAALAVVGLGVGALMSGGGGGTATETTASASSPAPSSAGGGKQLADPAKDQATALDTLLSESNDSREAVIGAVADTKSCDDLDKASSDLQDAAKQRRGLVTKLKGLSLDKLPDGAALASALTAGWQASAAADDHYAQWARQAESHKVCRHGSARRTDAADEGDQASGEATTAKTKASKLWNTIATTYGLQQRTAAQL